MMDGDLLRSKVDPSVVVDPKAVARVVEEVFPEALGVWIYGSFADGTARRGSDIDIAILPERPLDAWNLHTRAVDVAGRLGREVDLIDLRRVPLLLRFEVASKGVRVAARDPITCDHWEISTIGLYQQFYAELKDRLQDIRERGAVL